MSLNDLTLTPAEREELASLLSNSWGSDAEAWVERLSPPVPSLRDKVALAIDPSTDPGYWYWREEVDRVLAVIAEHVESMPVGVLHDINRDDLLVALRGETP